ncbi:hypothetical protein ACH3PA_18365 [Leeuwenhoekiella sp. A2]|uniref:hypothetical protein n=1 Tax=Leeuwenhoekiella sp. A2 TaxID=3141460 RepID=UPI003A807D4F
MENIKSTDFYNAWIETVFERKAELLKIWRNAREFTACIKGCENSIVADIGKKLNLLTYENDYYSIDTIFYRPEDLAPKIKPNTYWFRDIRIAFEHENSFNSGLYQEISHLLITNCDLKVLVAYPDYEPDEMLIELHEIIKGNRQSTEIEKNENFLLIFGYENGFEWEGYVYKETEWKKL